MPDIFTTPDPAPQKEEETKKETHSPLKNALGLFTTFLQNPTGLSFEHQEVNETILLFLRRHWFVNVRWILTALGVAILPPILLALSPFWNDVFPISPQVILILVSFYYLILFGYVLTHSIIWFYNIGIVTNLRVVDIDVHNISSKSVATTGITDIVDVEYHQKGVLAGFFDFGDINMQTEGIKPNFEFLCIPKPAKTADVINDLVREMRPNE